MINNNDNSKRTLQKNLHEIIKNNTNENDVYFVTFTFENTFTPLRQENYIEYFKFFYRKLNQFTLSSSKQYYTRSSMILIPEESHQCVKKNMYAATHYHGFLLVHKNNADRFNRRCVQSSVKDNVLLQDALLKPYPKSRQEQNSTQIYLKTHSVLLHPLTTLDDIKYTSFYMTKNINNSTRKYDDILLFGRTEATRKKTK